MKKIIIIAVAAVICSAIIGGSFYALQVNKQKSIERQKLWDLEQEEKEFILSQKIECAKYINDIKNDIEKFNNNSFSDDWYAFEMMFYSPKENSCIYVTERLPDREYFIHNYLTKNRITSFRFPEQFDDYKKFILEYSDGEIRL